MCNRQQAPKASSRFAEEKRMPVSLVLIACNVDPLPHNAMNTA